MINKPSSKKRIAIFDLDGTLIDSDKWLSRELVETFKGLGISITEEEAAIEGKRDKYTLANKYGFSKEELDRSYKENVKSKCTLDNALHSGELTLYPETLSTLDSLRDKGIVLGLLPRATRKSDIVRKVKHLGLEEYFGNRIVIVPNNHNTKYMGAQNLLRKIQDPIGKIYCIGDRAEDVLLAEHLKNSIQIDAEGMYVHRFDSPDPKLRKYLQVKSLSEIPPLVSEE